MKTLTCAEPHKMVLEDIPGDLHVPDDWVPFDVLRVGICGTDYHIFSGTQPYLSYPRVMGHEVSGRVSEGYTGEHFKPGDLVIANPYLACGSCHACGLGKPNCCENIEVIGVHKDGAMTERYALPASNLILAEGLTPDQAAMVEFLAIGCHAVARTGVIAGAKALVVGGGPIGLAVALFARIAGLDVLMADTSDQKLALLKELFGFDGVNAMYADKMNELDNTVTHVFDATGSIKAMNDALRFVANGGTYTLVSVVKGTLSFEDPEFHRRETSLFSSRNALRQDFEAVIAAIKAGHIETDKIKSHATSMDDAAKNIAVWAQNREQVIKAIIEIG